MPNRLITPLEMAEDIVKVAKEEAGDSYKEIALAIGASLGLRDMVLDLLRNDEGETMCV